MVQVTAGWALSGKRPGSSDDYGVLNCSREPFSKASFGRILRQYGLGTPPAHRTGEGALPWVTVSWVGEAPDRYLGMSIEDWTEHRDGSGRPVAFTKYICVPYRDVQATPVSYAALYRELNRLELPMDGPEGDLVTLSPPEYSAADLARDIDRFDRKKVMRTAALLLDGRVDIVGAGEASLQDRLAFLDAVAALLPYGYRADFTGATWATGSANKIRLAFLRRARDNANEVGWRNQGERIPPSPTAGHYLQWLDRLLSRRDLPWLVGYLAGGAEPCDFSDKRSAVQHLADVEWPQQVARYAEERRQGKEEDARRLLLSPRRDEISPSAQGRVLAYLIRAAEPGDLKLIGERWDQVAATGGSELIEALVDAAARLLWREEPDKRVSDYVRLARERRLTDQFLAGVVEALRVPGFTGGAAKHRAALDMAADLIRDHVDPAAPAWANSKLLAELTNESRLAARLLVAEPGGADRVRAWVRWLGSGRSDALPGFGELLAGREISLKDFRGLMKGAPEWAAALVQVAGRLGRLEPVMPALIGWMKGQPEISLAAREFVKKTLSQMESEEPGGWGAADVVLLTVGAPCVHLKKAVLLPDPATYHSGFVWAWQRVRQDRGMAATFIRELASALRDQRPWAGGPARADTVINLVRAVIVEDEGLDWTILRTVLDTEPSDPALEGRPAFVELRRLLRENQGRFEPVFAPALGATPDGFTSDGYASDGFASDGMPPPGPPPPSLGAPALEGLGRLASDADVDTVADFYMRAMRPLEANVANATAAIKAVAAAGRLLKGAEAHTVVLRVWGSNVDGSNYQWADKQARLLVEAIAQGALGSAVARDFADALAGHASQEISYQLRLLEAVSSHAPFWEMPPQVRTRLEECKATIERLAKSGRGGLFGLGRRGKSGDG
ncbi:hypothetical protein [Actinomadura sp. NEAU-AAG7]|uniref:hypothetical protein n=1 Tax=Actinomadura sp. NEAU-AAG7 TaxID=2839640 RepID=UPI001BE44338|nr:hypothetical protein [Actinomadura sp. NEAU-AAG7]MBT2207803.1 hypothetical protein [Actinomadura sp. NEAU-AAG7]